jgi:hypothetical protein
MLNDIPTFYAFLGLRLKPILLPRTKASGTGQQTAAGD